jgi:flagellar biosynthetic protein FliP
VFALSLILVLLASGCRPCHASSEPMVTEPLAELVVPKSQSLVVPPDSFRLFTEGSESWIDRTGKWSSPGGLTGSVQMMLGLGILSLAPAVLLMTTCYVRIVIVLGLLRQAIGLQTLPPSQVMTSVALFMTLFVMTPIWTRVYEDAIVPYTDPQVAMPVEEALEAGVAPIRGFMSQQIDNAGNHDDVHLFFGYLRPDGPFPETFDEVPLRVLLPAYLISELKTAFLMGFQIYLPFLIVDLVVASVTISMGMMMLPPAVIALPLKLLLFVMVDGWRLVVQMLMDSFGTIG